MGAAGEIKTTSGRDSDAVDSGLDLVGSSSNSLDSKRRVAIPKAFREQIQDAGLDGAFVLCRQLGGDPCLALFAPGCFERKLRGLEDMRKGTAGVGTKTVRAYLRKLRMSAARLIPDKQNRITLTEAQCELAGISKEVTFVGCGDHLELWSPDRLQTTDETLNFGDLANELFGDLYGG